MIIKVTTGVSGLLRGGVKRERLLELDSRVFSIKFSEIDTLVTLWIEPGYESYAPNFKHTKVRGRLLLFSKGINDAIFQKISRLPGFEELDLLLIDNTSISVFAIASLNLSHIKEFSFELDENPAAHVPMLTALKILKGKYPQCHIAYGHDEVMI